MSLNSVSPVAEAPRAATRAQLLEAAAAVFAEQGFRAATVREICRRAGANVAAINYHFGDKERLYAETLGWAVRSGWEQYPVTLGLGEHPGPEERLRAFVRSFLLRIFDRGTVAIRGRLILREMVEPTAALDVIVESQLGPMAQYLASVVRAILGPRASEGEIRLHGMSIVGQVLFYHHSRPFIRRLFPDMKFGPDEIERLTDHVTRFSLAALLSAAKAKPADRRRR